MNNMISWLKDKVNELVVQNPTATNPRLTGYLDFRLNQGILHFITIDGTRLHYYAFEPDETVHTLQQQFQLFHKRELNLKNNEVVISPEMPLCQIITSLETKQIFQEIVSKIDRREELKLDDLDEIKKQKSQMILKKCNEFSEYKCKIHMQNGPQKPLQINCTIEKNITFNTIIKQMNTHPHIIGEDIVFRSKKKEFKEQTYSKTFQKLNIREKQLYAHYSNKNSFIRGNSKVLVPNFQEGLPIQSIKQKNTDQVVTYNSQNFKFNLHKITNFQEKIVQKYYRLSLSLKDENEGVKDKEHIFECTGSVRIFVFTKDFDQLWIPVDKLSIEDQIGGIDDSGKTFAIYKLNKIQQIKLQIPEKFFGIQVESCHQYIANNIIVHNNNDKFSIKAYHIKGEKKAVKEVIFQRSQQIRQVFGDKICQVGGRILKNSQTFGDYQLQQFRAIFVYENLESLHTKKREYTISQWKKETLAQQEISEQYKEQLSSGYLGIYQQRIIHPKQIKEIYQKQQTKNVNILVGIRTYFQRLNYIINKQPIYPQCSAAQQEQYWNMKKDQKLLIDLCQKVQKGKMKISRYHLLAIFLYTCDDVYGPLNAFLRDKYLQNLMNQQKKYLPLAKWICNGLKRAQTYRGVVYRGITNIDIKKVFRLQQKQIKKDRVIVFTSFTSASKLKKVAEFFTYQSKKSVILTFKVSSGRAIQYYSQFPLQKQVLIQPFTYFSINSYSTQGQKQTAELEQIPMAQTNSKKIIFWVDDQPQNNTNVIKYVFQKQGIEVVQITSTKIMKIILYNFLWIFKMLGRKVVIISDMQRNQQGKKNPYAGVDLFQHIYKQYGLSNKAIIFTMKRKLALDKLVQRGIKPGNWAITIDETDLVREVMEQFQKMQ